MLFMVCKICYESCSFQHSYQEADRALVNLLQLRKGNTVLEIAVTALGAAGADLLTYHKKILVDCVAAISEAEESD